MRPVSQRFLDAITGSHNMAVRLRAVPAGQTGTSPLGGIELRLIDGDVQLDGRADIRSTLDCTVAAVDPDTGALLWPEQSDAPLTPYGATELYVERGLAFGGGSIEYVSLGYFRIDDVEQPEAPDGPIQLAGTDRMSNIIDAKLTAPLQFPASTTYGELIEELVTDAYADAEIEWDDTDVEGDAIGRVVVVESDRYAKIKEFVTAVGKVAYFDHRGIMVIRTPPDPTSPLWTVSRGRGGVLVKASRSISRQGVYNGVIAIGEAFDTAEPARGLAVDDDPASPTYWGGAFGKIAREFASPLLTSDSQAELAAATVLRRSLGLPYNVEFDAIPNPALEPDDPIAIGLQGAPEVVLPKLIMGDSFSRTVVDGVGTSESNHDWSVAAGGSANYQVGTGVLSRTIANNTSAVLLQESSIARADVDIYAEFMAPNVATGAALVAGTVLRYATNTDFYVARIEFNLAGALDLKLGDHFGGVTEPVHIPGYATYSAGQWWTTRVRARGDKIEFKAWPSAGAQPDEWAYTYSGARLGGVGDNRFGLYWWRVNGNTNNSAPQYQHDNFRAYDVPTTILRGGELHVVDSLTVPLTAEGAMSGTTREQTLVTVGFE